MTKKLLTINLEDLVDLVFFIYSESDAFDIGSPSATAFPADLEEGDCGEEKMNAGLLSPKATKATSLPRMTKTTRRILQLMI